MREVRCTICDPQGEHTPFFYKYIKHQHKWQRMTVSLEESMPVSAEQERLSRESVDFARYGDALLPDNDRDMPSPATTRAPMHEDSYGPGRTVPEPLIMSDMSGSGPKIHEDITVGEVERGSDIVSARNDASNSATTKVQTYCDAFPDAEGCQDEAVHEDGVSAEHIGTNIGKMSVFMAGVICLLGGLYAVFSKYQTDPLLGVPGKYRPIPVSLLTAGVVAIVLAILWYTIWS